MHKKKFLIIDDEQDILDLLDYNLSKEGYSITLAQNGLEGLDKINSDIDLIILDVMMPKMDGLEFCKHVKSKTNLQNIPIIFLTAKDDEIDEIIGLEIGADDYIHKPISIRTLKTRIKVVLKRYEMGNNKYSNKFICNNLMIDYKKYRVVLDNIVLPLTKNETEILFLLSKSPNHFFTREQILNTLWSDVIVSDRTVDTHIVNLRAKLKDYSILVETKRGIGYSFNPSLYNEKE
tara:strand:- start:33 stop:734 length:702 start_codon:yes stop_codon:yes gene_type:complete